MGVEDFWTKALGDFHEKQKAKLSDYAGKQFAVDISGWIHAALHSSEGHTGIAATSMPKYPPEEVVDIIMRKHHLLVDNKISPFYVFDGKPHDMKHERHLERQEAVDKARREFVKLLNKAKSGDEITKDDLKRAIKSRKAMVAPGDALCAMICDKFEAEGIPFMVAPFEAEMQMVYLEKNHFVDGMMTEDSDAVVLSG